MRIALASLDQQWLDKESNFIRCAELARVASAHRCELIIFPEMTLTGYSLDMQTIAEPSANSPTLMQFEQLALSAKVNIMFGACLLGQHTSNPQNAICLATHEGDVKVLYTKIHPFSFAGENKVMHAGNTLGYTSIEGLRLGCSICYDLRFAEMFSVMAPTCDAIVNIANWPNRRIAHWRTLLVARAIENQLFVFGVNRIGVDGNGLSYENSSMVVSPEGIVLKPIFTEAEIAVYDIDQTKTERHREEFPTVRDKRFELYREFYEGM